MSNTTLYLFTPAWGIASVSPYCVKADIFLRMAKVDFECAYPAGPPKSSTGKLPYLVHNTHRIEDSQNIIKHIKENFGVDLDEHLSDEQRMQSHFVRRTLEDGLYFNMLYERWMCDDYWPIVKRDYFAFLPPIVRSVLPALVRRDVQKMSRHQGLGRRPKSEVIQIGHLDIDAFAQFLADKKYVMGDKLSNVDATAYGFFKCLLSFPAETPLQVHTQRHQNILNYCEGITQEFGL